MAEKKFCDMDSGERFVDLKERISKFDMLQLPGQPQGMHMGTAYLIGDLWSEFQKFRTSMRDRSIEEFGDDRLVS